MIVWLFCLYFFLFWSIVHLGKGSPDAARRLPSQIAVPLFILSHFRYFIAVFAGMKPRCSFARSLFVTHRGRSCVAPSCHNFAFINFSYSVLSLPLNRVCLAHSYVKDEDFCLIIIMAVICFRSRSLTISIKKSNYVIA